MAYPDARIFVLDRTGIQETRYHDTEHYAVTKTFLDDPARMLRDIFRDVDPAGEP